MADKNNETEDENKAAEGEGAPKSGKRKKLIIIALVVLLLIGGGAGAYFGGFIGGGHGTESAEAGAEEAPAEEGGHGEAASSEGEGGHGGGEKGAKPAKQGPVVAGQPIYYNLPEFIVNLNPGGKQTSFIKMTVSLELESEKDMPAVEANLPRIMDSFNGYLREMRAADLSGSAGLYRLREELMVRLNKTLAPAKIKDVLFKEILVQ